MNPARCLINLSLLSDGALTTGYSAAGVKSLFGGEKVALTLPFTRREFLQDMPVRQAGMSISGYQPKLSLRIEGGQLRVVNNGGAYILKPSPEEYPHLAENEHATMSVMRRLKFAVPPFGLIRFAPGEDRPQELAFIIKRYDRQGDRRIHQEQLDGAMSVSDKYGQTGEGKAVSYERAGKFIGEQVSGSLKDKRDLFLRIVYAYVLGNNDFHLRNLGIIHPVGQAPRLAPVYDFVSVVPYPSSFTEYLALPLLEMEERNQRCAPGIESAYSEYTGADFLLLAQGVGLALPLAKKLLQDVVKSHALIESTYADSHLPDAPRTAILKYVARRMTLLQVLELA